MILAGDVGGTWTRLALLDDRARRIEASSHTKSATHARLEDAVVAFLRETGARVSAVGVGIAGPVIAGECKTTNLPWLVSAARLQRAAGAKRSVLLNDLVALALGAIAPGATVRSLANGTPKKRGANLAILAAGTGLGEAALVWGLGKHGGAHYPLGTEGGHGDFAPRCDVEEGLLRFARERFGHVSYERFVAGPGISLIYDFFLKELSAGKREPAIDDAPERNVAIVEAAKSKTSEAAVRTVETFLDLFGAEAGNLALRTLATGGVFVGGSLANSLLVGPYAERFMRAFTDKGRMANLLAHLPVAVVTGDNVAIFGAARAALAK